MLFALAVEWSSGGLVTARDATEHVRSWWAEPEPEDEADDDWGATPEAQDAIAEVKRAMGIPAGVVRPRPGQFAAVASAREHAAPSDGEAPHAVGEAPSSTS